MSKLESFLESMPIDWLLDGEPFIRYRTLTDLLDREDVDAEVVRAKEAIPEHRLVQKILDKQNRDGYWGTPTDIYAWWPRKDTTFWLLGVLADFGFTRHKKEIDRACEYVFSTQLGDGGFGCGPPYRSYDCFTGILAESLGKLGYGDDSRLRKAYEWLTRRQRVDGGFWCKNTGQPGGTRQDEPSCAFGSLCVLGALTQDPKLKKTPIAENCLRFLLKCWENRDKIKYAGHDSQIGRGWEKLKYPFTDYRVLKYLDIISRLEFIKGDSRIAAMIDVVLAKRDKKGRFFPESIHKVWSDFDFGQKKSPSRWITLVVYRIAKRLVTGTTLRRKKAEGSISGKK